MTDKTPPDAVTLLRAARYLGVSVRTVQRLGAAGKLTLFQYSRRATRVSTQSLVKFRQTREMTSAT